MILDRKVSPPIQEIKKANILRASETRLKNNIPVYCIHAGTQDLVRIELIFQAGMWQQPAPLTGSAANAMIQEGTSTHSSKEIAEIVDYYGAFLETNITHDFAVVTLYSLNKHLTNVLPIVEEILSDSVFSQNEWDLYLQNKKQSFIVNNNKVNFVSQKKFAELLFGHEHPYGYNVSEKDYNNLKKEGAYTFYKQAYTSRNTIIIASGNVTEVTLKLIEKHFEHMPPILPSGPENRNPSLRGEPVNAAPFPGRKEGEGSNVHYIEKKDALQSAIRIGKLLFTKPHPDYPGMQVLNTILGGYFGSRLMSNIREDKGYTYGISSGVVSFSHGGYFTISTEVSAEFTHEAVKEIYFEIHRLQTEKIAENEMQLVRNYMLGSFLRSIDGPFALANRFKGIYFSGLDYDYYERYIETIRTITAEKLMELAIKYWKKEEMIELVVGKK